MLQEFIPGVEIGVLDGWDERMGFDPNINFEQKKLMSALCPNTGKWTVMFYVNRKTGMIVMKPLERSLCRWGT